MSGPFFPGKLLTRSRLDAGMRGQLLTGFRHFPTGCDLGAFHRNMGNVLTEQHMHFVILAGECVLWISPLGVNSQLDSLYQNEIKS